MNFIKASVVLGHKQLQNKLLTSRSTCIPLMVASSTQSQKTVPPTSNLDAPLATEWQTIYRLPIIRLVAAFNRLKLYQGMVVAAGVPAMYGLEKAGEMQPNVTMAFAAIGVTGFLTLTVCSYLFQNLIGIVYINGEKDKLKLAYVDFWGKRKDTVLSIKDIVPIWEQVSLKKINFFYSVQTTDKKHSYKILYRFGHVLDPEVFSEIFGE